MFSSSINWLIWVPSCLGFAAFQGWLCAGSGFRRWLAVGLGAAALAVPFMLDGGTVLRAAVALHMLWASLKVITLARERENRPLVFRVVQMLVLHDLRRDGYVKRGLRPQFRRELLSSSVLALMVAFGALYGALFVAPELASPWGWVAQNGFGVVFAYFGVEGALRGFEFVYRALGLGPPILHAHPILSRSVGEFWGRRWNRIVGSWLFATFYRPLALSGRRQLGSVSAFVASGALHLYFTWAAVGFGPGLIMASFFLVQVPLVWLEERSREQSWPVFFQHVWTLGAMVLSSPLFIEPLLTILRGGFARG